MTRRLISRIKAAASRPIGRQDVASQSHFERLEPRILFSATGPAFIQDIFADNRGLITMEVCGELDSATLNDASVQVFTAGDDNLFGTFDDVTESRDLTYDAATGSLMIMADLDAGSRYGLRLDGSMIRGVNGFLLDGEFNGADTQTGDGISGGDLLFYTKTAPIQIARVSTNLGDIDIELFTADTPLSVANFLTYANDGRYDNIIFHRLVDDFVIQGGGYANELGFERIERDDTIFNEPGISNLRGTVSFAKLGNNPNSATSEWFFNLGDNSENLDNQNGGFTVFGEITDDEGLAVMDAIAALDTIDASGIDGAFTDFPVTDVDALNGNPASVTPALSVSISRISLVQDLSATPPEQLQAESFTFESNRDVFVTVYDLGGIGRDELDNAIEVKFNGNRVSSITVVGDFPAGSLGLVIGDANRVGTIKDSGADSSIGFIFSNAPVNSINLKGDVLGANINGLNLGGVLLADDIDGDGVFDDETAILINDGMTNSITSTGAIVGDIVAPGGLSVLTLKGQVTESEIRIGAAPDPATTLKAQIVDASNTTLDSLTPIQNLTVGRWSADNGAENGVLNAPSIQSLKLNGVFDVDVTLTGAPVEGDPTLGKLNARFGLVNTTFNVSGDIGPITVKGDTSGATINASGSIRSIKLGDVLNTSFMASGSEMTRSIKLGRVVDTDITLSRDVKNLTARSWEGGSLSASSITTLKVTNSNAEFNPDITMTGAGVTTGFVSKNIIINSEITGGTWSVTGNTKTVKIKDAHNAELVFSGSLDKFASGDLDRFELGIQNVSKSITTGEWIRGSLAVNTLTNLQVSGDFRADVTATRANRINITGDLFRSDMRFAQAATQFGTPSLNSLTVGGEIRDVEIRAIFRIVEVSAKAMHNSIIGVSNSIPQRTFPMPGDVDQFSFIDQVTITGPRSAEPNFSDSFIVAGVIGDVILGEVDEFNFGQNYGVGANELDSVSYIADGERITLRNNDLLATPEPFGDFDIRIGFLNFDDSGA